MQFESEIKAVIEGLLSRMGIPFDEVSRVEKDGSHAFVVKTRDSGALIGAKGAHISAFNHLVKRIIGKRKDVESVNFYVDVNDYHDRLLTELKNKASILAERARSFRSSVEMEPMSSYERMIIHSHFQNVPDIETESRGDGSRRHVVLKYVENINTDSL